MVILEEAKIEDREKFYNWLFKSDFSDYLLEIEGLTRESTPAYEEFCNEYFDFFFDGSQPQSGRGYKIADQNSGEELGFIYYTAFHVQTGIAEIDLWLKSLEIAGKGIGTEAIDLLVTKLTKELQINKFFIRPARLNTRAVNAFKKAGFKEAELVYKNYYKPEFLEEYRKGNFGEGKDIFLVRSVK